MFRTMGPEGNCPACGSPEIEQIVFEGLFDSRTSPDEIARVMTSVTPEQLAAEDHARPASASPLALRVVAPPSALLQNSSAPSEWPPIWVGW